MELVDFTRFILAFILVLGLIGLMWLLLKRYGRAQRFFYAKEGGRLEIMEVKYLDSRRRLLLIRRDETEHLLLLADGREMVIESRTSHAPR